jgi:hypothetical protein
MKQVEHLVQLTVLDPNGKYEEGGEPENCGIFGRGQADECSGPGSRHRVTLSMPRRSRAIQKT